jgi:hypothetical protein
MAILIHKRNRNEKNRAIHLRSRYNSPQQYRYGDFLISLSLKEQSARIRELLGQFNWVTYIMKNLLIISFLIVSSSFVIAADKTKDSLTLFYSTLESEDNVSGPDMALKKALGHLDPHLGQFNRSERIQILNGIKYFLGEFELSDELVLEFYKEERDRFAESDIDPSAVFRKMTILNGLFEDSHSYKELFFDLTNEIGLKFCQEKTGDECIRKEDIKVYTQIMEAFIQNQNNSDGESNDLILSKYFLNTVTEMALYSLDSVQRGASLKLSFELLNDYLKLFDQDPRFFSSLNNCSKEEPGPIRKDVKCIGEYFSLQDRRINQVMYQFSSILRSASTKKKQEISTYIDHPYLEMYLLRNYIEYSYNDEDKRGADQLIQKMFYSEDLSYQDMYRMFFTRINNDDQFESSVLDSYTLYHKNIYELEFARFYREIIHFQNDEKNKNLSAVEVIEIDKLYDYQLELLIKTLNIRYQRSLDFIGLTYQNSPQDKNYREEFTEGEVLKDLENSAQMNIGQCHEVSAGLHCDDIELFTGIYFSKKDILIQGNKMRMGPLAMIYAPGKSVTFNFNRVENIWVDTSGKNASFKIRKLVDKDTEPHSIPPTPPYNGGPPSTRPITPPFHIENGQKVLPGGRGGNKGGDMTFNIKWKLDGIPLLVSRGSQGQKGLPGIKSIKCTKAPKQVFTIGWSVAQRYNVNVPYQERVCILP